MIGSLALAVAAGCGGGERRADRPPSDDPGRAAATTGVGADTTCPPTGLWQPCSVLDRLDRAGLAPQPHARAVRRDPLTVEGMGFTVGRGELQVFIYPTSEARERDQRLLDTSAFVRPGQSVSLRNEPTLIATANALAILRSPSERQRERVADAFTAGPPQPPQR